MELLRQIVAGGLISVGILFLAISAVGVITLPGFFSRAHAVAKSETLGIIAILGGLAVLNGFARGTPQLLVIIVISSIANPTAVHALARAAAFRARDVQASADARDVQASADPGEVTP
jgi:monovalent cation/proton antiporter MnhG/PhaG subunit